jgi:hypothetical protein
MQNIESRQSSPWKMAYQEALFELDPTLLRHKLNAAQIAVDHRLFQVMLGEGTYRELTELQDAKRTIEFLGRQECPS